MHPPPPVETAYHSPSAQELRWLLENLVAQVPGTRRAVLVSDDGLLLLSSDPAHQGTAPTPWGGDGARAGAETATVVSGIDALTRCAAGLMNGGPVRRLVVTMAYAGLVVTPVPERALLAVETGPGCDTAVVAQQAAVCAAHTARLLTPEVRRELRATVPLAG